MSHPIDWSKGPAWVQAGMSHSDYMRLPWKGKKKVLRKLAGTPPWVGFIRDIVWFFKWNLYEKHRRPDLRPLFKAWCQERADRFTIWEKYPGVTIDENDRHYR